jgi:hypothetical protein
MSLSSILKNKTKNSRKTLYQLIRPTCLYTKSRHEETEFMFNTYFANITHSGLYIFHDGRVAIVVSRRDRIIEPSLSSSELRMRERFLRARRR